MFWINSEVQDERAGGLPIVCHDMLGTAWDMEQLQVAFVVHVTNHNLVCSKGNLSPAPYWETQGLNQTHLQPLNPV